jgi:uncharacterized membrane protein
MTNKFEYRKLLQYFLQGLLVLAPVLITFYVIFVVVTYIDNLIPFFTVTNAKGEVKVQNYGLGFIVIILLILTIGYFSYFFITNRIILFFDRLMQRLPGLKHIYSTTRDFFEAFAGDKKKFTQNVLVNIDETDIWRLGFVTKDDMNEFGLNDHVAGYVPSAYSVAGNVVIVPKYRVKYIPNINSTQFMKFAVSGGITNVLEEEKEKKPTKYTFLLRYFRDICPCNSVLFYWLKK